MLPRENRLKNTREIDVVFRRGKGLGADFLLLKLVKNNLMVSRFAFIVSRKIARKAVHRNQIKRRLRAAVKKRLADVRDGFDVVVIAQKSTGGRSFQEITKVVDKIFKKSNLLKP